MEPNKDTKLAAWEAAGVLWSNAHVVLKSGRHSDAYFNKDMIYADPAGVSEWCREMAAAALNWQPVAVVGPAMGGIILSQWTAYHLAALCDRPIKALYAEKQGESFVLRRGYDRIVAGQLTLVVEDVLTTGDSAAATVAAVRSAGGLPVGVAALCDRRGLAPSAPIGGLPVNARLKLDIPNWPAESCPLCAVGAPVTTAVGHGAEFLRSLGR